MTDKTEKKHTKDILADALREAGLDDMAKKAKDGYYHDYLSKLDMPDIQLLNDLRAADTPAAHALAERHMNGEFDASLEESEDWARSADGRDAMTKLFPNTARALGLPDTEPPSKTASPFDPPIAAMMSSIGQIIGEEAAKVDYGFALVMFPFAERGGSMNYVSNADQPSLIEALKELVQNLERATKTTNKTAH